MSKHCFNILTFNHQSDSHTFYFSDKEEEGTTRIYHSLVLDEVIDKYAEQEHYYTSFCKEIEGFYKKLFENALLTLSEKEGIISPSKSSKHFKINRFARFNAFTILMLCLICSILDFLRF